MGVQKSTQCSWILENARKGRRVQSMANSASGHELWTICTESWVNYRCERGLSISEGKLSVRLRNYQPVGLHRCRLTRLFVGCETFENSRQYQITINALSRVDGGKCNDVKRKSTSKSWLEVLIWQWHYWYAYLPYPNSQLANQKPTLLSWYPTISSHWPDSATVTLNFGLNLGTVKT